MATTFRPFEGFVGARETAITLANGANQNVVIASSFVTVLSGPTAGFSIGGIAGGNDGQIVTIWSQINQTMTVNDNDGGSSVGNKIRTSTLGNIACGGTFFSWFTVQFSTSNNTWILMGHS